MSRQPSEPKRRGILSFLSAIGASLTNRYTSPPQGIEPVRGFDAERYLGRWYEVKRLDHSFERGATNVYAEYSLRNDGKIRVLNSAYNPSSGKRGSIEGYARFQHDPSIASLSVTFFWPITAGYHVIELDHADYQWAMVTGPNRNYLWILSRTPKLSANTLDHLLGRAEGMGYAVNSLISVEHNSND